MFKNLNNWYQRQKSQASETSYGCALALNLGFTLLAVISLQAVTWPFRRFRRLFQR